MKISVKYITIVFIVLLSHNFTYGQISSNGIENIEQEISDLILQQTGDRYFIAAYNKNYYPNLNFGFENPNQIFSNGYLFTTMGPVDNDSDERYAFVGIYKDGGILWQSEKEILFNNLNSDVLGILDINGDGNVEIISQWDQGMRGTSTELWIYSWNGVSGERINTIDVFGESEIKLKDYSIQVVDFEPNGIKEIIGVDWNDEPVTFQWNGMNYIKSMTARPNPLPRNALDAALSVQVASIGTKFRYNFSVFNSEESLQSIEDIALKNLANPPSTVILPKNWEFSPNMSNGLISWSIKIPLDYFRESLIKPGESTDSLSFYSLGIPRVSSFFIQGNNGKYGISSSSVLMSNSFSGYTLGPWLPDSTMSLDSFTDTLETFRFRSCEELGWANDGTVCGQLEDDLSAVKANLQAGDSLSAANALSNFIELVEQEKGESLTSEGYALLYFNAEYLAERLPEPVKEPEGSGITCECANPVTQTSGQIRFSGGETQCLSGEFSGSVFFQQTGRLEVCGNATFQNISGNNIGTVAVSETGVVSIQNWNNNNSADSLINWGSMEFRNQVNVNRGQLINHGELTVNGGLNQNNGSLTNSGTLTVNRAMNLNQPGTMNTGVLSIGQRLTLNSNASLINECRVSVNGPVQLNGTFTSESGSVLQSTGRMTINSQGVLQLNGAHTMVWIDALRLNGSIESNGSNQLLYSQNTIQPNNRAEINSASDLLQVWAPNINSLLGNYSITDGTNAVIPAGACNPDGFNN